MGTKNPRINLVVPPQVYDLVKRFANVSGTSMSAAIVELLVQARPVLERVVVVGETARKVQQEAKGAFKAKVEETTEVMEGHLNAATDQADLFLSELEDHLRRAGAAAAHQPRAARLGRPVGGERVGVKKPRKGRVRYQRRAQRAKPK